MLLQTTLYLACLSAYGQADSHSAAMLKMVPYWSGHPLATSIDLPLKTVRQSTYEKRVTCMATVLGHPTKTPNDLREAPVRRGQRQQGGFLCICEGQRLPRWSADYDACIDCGTTQRPHRPCARCGRSVVPKCSGLKSTANVLCARVSLMGAKCAERTACVGKSPSTLSITIMDELIKG